MHILCSPSASRRLVFVGLTLITLLLAAGCQKSVTIEYPAKGNSKAPVTTFRVRFHNDFAPGSFAATLNGQNITNRFQPAPVAGGVSTASSDYMDATNNTNQVLEVHGLFKTSASGIPTKATGDLVEFSPPTIWVFRGVTTNNDLSLKERETITATVTVLEVPREGLPVILTTEESSVVSINNAPAGTPTTVTIPNNDRRADFTVRGIEANQKFRIRPLAHGYASKLGGGTVFSP